MYANDRLVGETVSFQENIGMRCKAVGSPYVSQNASETLRESHKSSAHMSRLPCVNPADPVILLARLQPFRLLIPSYFTRVLAAQNTQTPIDFHRRGG